MRKLLKRRLVGIPLVAILVLILATGSALASYAAISGTVTVEVLEPFTAGYRINSSSEDDWVDITGSTFEIDAGSVYPGYCANLDFRVHSDATVPILARIAIVSPSGITFTSGSALFTTGINVPAEDLIVRSGIVCADHDAAPGTYNVTVTLYRG